VVVILQSHLQVALCDLRRIGIHCIDHDLYAGRLPTAQSAREIGRNYQEEIQIKGLESLFRLFRVSILTGHLEIHILGEGVDQSSAFGCETFIHDAETQIANLRVQGISEYDQHNRRRQHQLDQQDAIAPELLDFLGSESNVTSNECRHWISYPLNCIFRI